MSDEITNDQKLAAAIEALEPFAELGEVMNKPSYSMIHDDSEVTGLHKGGKPASGWCYVTGGDFRKAVAALASLRSLASAPGEAMSTEKLSELNDAVVMASRDRNGAFCEHCGRAYPDWHSANCPLSGRSLASLRSLSARPK